MGVPSVLPIPRLWLGGGAGWDLKLTLGSSKARRLAVAFPLWFPAPGFPREAALALREALESS